MNILAIGDLERYQELKASLSQHSSNKLEYSDGDEENFADYDVVFDLNFEDDPQRLHDYCALKKTKVIVSAVKHSLAEAAYIAERKINGLFVGMNCLKTFINREKWEVSLLHLPQKEQASQLFKQIGKEVLFVKDRVGMVSPRVILMIINEACYSLQEGTAQVAAIDQAMKLGTNYPMGPFEWANKIGITDVYEGLTAIYDDTKDERYKICPLLKSKYLRNEQFKL